MPQPDHVEEKQDGTVAVGKSQRERNQEKAKGQNQSDRIEAKLDLIMAELGIE